MFEACLLMLLLQEPPAAAPKPDKTDRAAETPANAEPNRPRAPKGVRKFMKGTLGGLNIEQRTVRFTDLDGREHVWPVDPKMAESAAARAADLAKLLQAGDPIMVVYQEDDGKPLILDVGKRGEAGSGRGEQPVN